MPNSPCAHSLMLDHATFVVFRLRKLNGRLLVMLNTAKSKYDNIFLHCEPLAGLVDADPGANGAHAAFVCLSDRRRTTRSAHVS